MCIKIYCYIFDALLQVDLGSLYVIKFIITHGDFDDGGGTRYTPFYTINYTQNDETSWDQSSRVTKEVIILLV